MQIQSDSKSHFIDAHTHVQFSRFSEDRDAVIERALAADVWMINVGTQIDTSRAAVDLAEREAKRGNKTLFAAVGLHPIHTGASFHDAQELGGSEAAKGFVSRGEIFDTEAYRIIATHPRTVAIGECGLDYFHFSDDESKEAQIDKQKKALRAQIELSLEIKKPLMIHCRNAFTDLIEILKEYKNDFDKCGIAGPGVIHFFTGIADDAEHILELGFSFTFGGAVTFPPRKGKVTGDYDEVLKRIPVDRILSETDAPYVAPLAYRGKRNEPIYIVETIKRLAQLKLIAPEEMKENIWHNARRIFLDKIA